MNFECGYTVDLKTGSITFTECSLVTEDQYEFLKEYFKNNKSLTSLTISTDRHENHFLKDKTKKYKV